MTQAQEKRLVVTLADKLGLVRVPCRCCGQGFLTSRFNPFEDCPTCEGQLAQDSVGPVVPARERS